jgi:hypothetical protein
VAGAAATSELSPSCLLLHHGPGVQATANWQLHKLFTGTILLTFFPYTNMGTPLHEKYVTLLEISN